MGRERRRRSRRAGQPGRASAGPLPAGVLPGSPEGAAETAPTTPSPSRRASSAPAQVRSDRVIARESEMMLVEMKRVLGVSVVCFGMLAVLVIVERLT